MANLSARQYNSAGRNAVIIEFKVYDAEDEETLKDTVDAGFPRPKKQLDPMQHLI